MSIPTVVLRYARERAGLKQAVMAERLNVNASVISRLERGQHSELTMARRYLEAIGTDLATEIVDFYARSWRFSERPAFVHPDREDLWAVEKALQALEAFAVSEQYDTLLDAPLAQIKANLNGGAAFLGRIDHSMAWIGTVGIGKTTALSILANLVLPGPSGQMQPIFPASGGRTTVSEVVVRVAPAFGIAVDPLDEDAIRLLVAELVAALLSGEGGISTELDRAVRNMADLRRTKAPSGKGFVDPIRDILAARDGRADETVEEIVRRMRLSERTETQMILSETSADGKQWLSEHVTRINFGQHPRFSIPERVTVFLPASALRQTDYELSVIDTKGVHVTTQRPDLRMHFDDPRTLSILCCGFNEAPGADAIRILQDFRQLGSDAIAKQRVVILVLPRGDEAMRVIDEAGEPPEDAEEGCAIRAHQVAATLAEAGLPQVPVLFFNAMEDKASGVWDELSRQLATVRSRQKERLHRFVGAAEELVGNSDGVKIEQARLAIAAEVDLITATYGRPANLVRPAHRNLVEQIELAHPSSIAASVVRRGSWGSFDVHHMIGLGVRVDANLRTADMATRIDGRLEGLADRFSPLLEVCSILSTLREDLADWRQEFLAEAARMGRAAFKPHLDADIELWGRLAARYGGGAGYRAYLSAAVNDWFEITPGLAQARERVENGLCETWREMVLERLADAVQTSPPNAGVA